MGKDQLRCDRIGFRPRFISHDIAHFDDSCGPDPDRSFADSSADSRPSDHDTKKPKESLGFVSICQALASLGFSIQVGDIGFEPTTSTMSTLRSNQLS